MVQTTEDASLGPDLMENRYGAGIQLTLNHPGTNNPNLGILKKRPYYYYETPMVYTNTIAIDKATDFSSVRLSYTNTAARGCCLTAPEKNNVLLTDNGTSVRDLQSQAQPITSNKW